MNSMNKTVLTPDSSCPVTAQGSQEFGEQGVHDERSDLMDAYEALTNDGLGLNFTFNGLQADLGLILDPLTPRRPLKGLLMDKGELAERAMAVEKTLGQLSKGMAQLKTVHRQFA
ncbi:MAG TPA: hypothetical protein PK129_01380 [Cellvibrionaceae bacterium]|nr:hypothetical protein [Cellvibrionaceae bacterium]